MYRVERITHPGNHQHRDVQHFQQAIKLYEHIRNVSKRGPGATESIELWSLKDGDYNKLLRHDTCS